MNQTEGIRLALEELGDEATGEQVRDWLKKKQIKPTPSFESILSVEKRKRKAKAKDSALSDDSIAALAETRALVDELGEERFRELLDAFERIHEGCGSWEMVRKMLEAMTGKPKKK